MANLHEAAAELRFFAEYNDVDGMIGAASRVATCATHLLGPEAILFATQSCRCDAEQARPVRAAACVPITAIARFDEIQLEVVAQEGTELVAILADAARGSLRPPACRRSRAIARTRGARANWRGACATARRARCTARGHGDLPPRSPSSLGLRVARSTAILTAAASAKAQNATASDGGAGAAGKRRQRQHRQRRSSAQADARSWPRQAQRPVSMDAAGPADAVAAAGSEAIESLC